MLARAKYLTLFFALFVIVNKAQVINIEGKRFLNDTNGFVGRSDLNFNITQNIKQVLNLGINVHVQYKHNKHRVLAISDLAIIKAADQDFQNTGYQHLRYSYKLHKLITWESFVQGQYNKVLLLDKRYLAGTGPRFRLLKEKHLRIYMATMYMYEFQSQANETIIQNNHRLNSYLTFNIDFDKFDFTSTSFYQPLLSDFSNYRIASDNNIDLSINNHFNFRIGLNLLYDVKQPPGVPPLVYIFRNGISFRF